MVILNNSLEINNSITHGGDKIRKFVEKHG